MQESIGELCTLVAESGTQAAILAQDRQFGRAKEEIRKAMGACSKLYARLGFLGDMESDANFVAEVDRALSRERMSRGFGPIPGDTALPFPPPEGEPPAPRKRGKGKG